MSTYVSCELAMIESKASGNFPGSEKLVHCSSVEKEIGASLYLRGFCVAGSTERILRKVNFCARLEGKPPSPPKMTLTTFFGS
jgi:hypothetical protein